jgi:hypothetical protein
MQLYRYLLGGLPAQQAPWSPGWQEFIAGEPDLGESLSPVDRRRLGLGAGYDMVVPDPEGYTRSEPAVQQGGSAMHRGVPRGRLMPHGAYNELLGQDFMMPFQFLNPSRNSLPGLLGLLLGGSIYNNLTNMNTASELGMGMPPWLMENALGVGGSTTRQTPLRTP